MLDLVLTNVPDLCDVHVHGNVGRSDHGLLNLIRPDSRSKQPKNRRRLFLRGLATFRYFFLLLNLEA